MLTSGSTRLEVREMITLLRAFTTAVWGQDETFKKYVIRPGSRVVEYLDFGDHLQAIQSFCGVIECARFLVVEEYRRAMDNFTSENPEYVNGACITGHPGIGKSCFIAYAVTERLRKKQPVAVEVSWPFSGAYILFASGSVNFFPHFSTTPLCNETALSTIWAFSDFSCSTKVPTVAFTKTDRVRTFQTVSAAGEGGNWTDWTKEDKINPYFMDLWSNEEVGDLVYMLNCHEGPQIDAESTMTLASRWGAAVRPLLLSSMSSRTRDAYEHEIRDGVKKAASDPDTIIKVIMGPDNPFDASPSKVFFIKPLQKDNRIYRARCTAFVPTSWLISLLLDELNSRAVATKMRFFNSLCHHPETRSSAGWILENLTHDFLIRTNAITILWNDDPYPETLVLPPLDLRAAVADLASAPPFYWRPNPTTNPGVYGALVFQGHVYVIQTMISPEPSRIQNGVDWLWDRMPNDKRGWKWRVLFATASRPPEGLLPALCKLKLPTKEAAEENKKYLTVGQFSLTPTHIHRIV